MKWKKQVWVFDDVIPKNLQEKIRATMLSSKTEAATFPWYFIPDITGSNDMRPGFSHTFILDEVIYSKHTQMLQPLVMNCMKKVNEKTGTTGNYSAIKARSFLQLPLGNVSGREYDQHHIDKKVDHFALLYYVCDADGDTVIFENMYSEENKKTPKPKELKEKIRVTPKQGRAVVFDGYYWHTATQPKDSVRCVVNIDIVQKA